MSSFAKSTLVDYKSEITICELNRTIAFFSGAVRLRQSPSSSPSQSLAPLHSPFCALHFLVILVGIISDNRRFLKLIKSFKLKISHICLFFVSSNHKVLTLSDPIVWRSPASVPASSILFVGTLANLFKVPLATLYNLLVPTSLRSSLHVHASARYQTNVVSNFKQLSVF